MQGFQKIFATFTSDQCKSIKSQIENEIKIAEGVGSLNTMVVLDDISQIGAENTSGSSGKKSTKKRSLKAIHGMFLEWWNRYFNGILLNFICSEKATKFWEIFILLLTCTT